MNYDLSWAANKLDIGVDFHIKKCHRNPIGLADVHVACTSKDKLCDYGERCRLPCACWSPYSPTLPCDLETAPWR